MSLAKRADSGSPITAMSKSPGSLEISRTSNSCCSPVMRRLAIFALRSRFCLSASAARAFASAILALALAMSAWASRFSPGRFPMVLLDVGCFHNNERRKQPRQQAYKQAPISNRSD
jgi:hypothetical protein